MKHIVSLGIALLALAGCSADVPRDDEGAAASADQAIATGKIANGRNLVADDPALTLELEGIDTRSLRARSLRIRLRGADSFVGELEMDGIDAVLFPGGARSQAVVSVTVVRGDGATLRIDDVTLVPGGRRDFVRFEGLACANGCANDGVCVRGQCFCTKGWTGPNCTTREQNACPGECSGNGTCRFGQCFCKPGFGGADCAEVIACSAKCLENGVCAYGKCFCVPGYTGVDCTEKL